jgi:hypothetical protein
LTAQGFRRRAVFCGQACCFVVVSPDTQAFPDLEFP